MKSARLTPVLLLAAALFAAAGRAADVRVPEFRRHPITTGTVLNGLAVADFDGDKRLDVAAAGPDLIAWYSRAPGAETWTPHPIRAKSPETPSVDSIALLPYDLDRDGDPDLLASTPGNGNLAWYENPGAADKAWTWRLIDRLPRIHSQALEDLDGDGKPELIANTEGMLVWYALPPDLRRAGGWERRVLTRDGVTGTPHYLTAADPLGTGKRVICAGAPDGAYLAWWERGPAGGEWTKHTVRAPLNGASHLRVADIDRDGKVDLFYSLGHTAGSAWLAGPDWTRETPIDAGTLKEPHALDLADLNGDGYPDVAAAARNTGGLAVWLNDRTGHFTRHAVAAEQKGMDLRIHDLDGDGDADLIVAGATGKDLIWYENTQR